MWPQLRTLPTKHLSAPPDVFPTPVLTAVAQSFHRAGECHPNKAVGTQNKVEGLLSGSLSEIMGWARLNDPG